MHLQNTDLTQHPDISISQNNRSIGILHLVLNFLIAKLSVPKDKIPFRFKKVESGYLPEEDY